MTPEIGKPILLVARLEGHGFYIGEILKAEGFNEYQQVSPDGEALTPSYLNSFDIVILGEAVLTILQKDMYVSYVENGGNLITLRPDKQLAPILGIKEEGAILKDGYLAIDNHTSIGQGLIDQTLQIHGNADKYTLNGAAVLATLFTDAFTATSNPAVVFNHYGKGYAAAFTYNLASNIVATHQGNKLAANQEKDGIPGIRAEEMFVDFLDNSKNSLNQADAQMSLFTHIIENMCSRRKPLPRFWYFPDMNKSIAMLTGDGEENSEAQISAYISDIRSKGIRSTLYIMIFDYEKQTVARWVEEGFEVSCHPNDTEEAEQPTWNKMNSVIQEFKKSLNSTYDLEMNTVRNHWILWCGVNANGSQDYSAQAQIFANHGAGLSTNYSHYDPESTSGNYLGAAGNFTGTGLLMKFSDLAGNIIDLYESPIQLFDQHYSVGGKTPEEFYQDFKTMVDNSLDREGYSFINVLAHPWNWEFDKDPVFRMIDYAKERKVPFWTCEKVLNFIKAKDQAAFSDIKWANNQLSFTISSALSAPGGLTFMIPASFDGKRIRSIQKEGIPVEYTHTIVKGFSYNLVTVTAGEDSHVVVTYAG